MSSISLHSQPRLRAVIEEQLAAVGLSIRKEAIAFLLTMLAFTALIIASALQAAHLKQDYAFSYGAGAAAPLAWLALFVPLAVWRREERRHPDYLLAMPVSRITHMLARVLSGCAWVVLAATTYILILACTTFAVTNIAGSLSASVDWWVWGVPISSAVLSYLLGFAVTLSSRHPERWLVGVPAAYMLCFLLTRDFGFPAAHERLSELFNSSFGLGPALFGAIYEQLPAGYVGASISRWLGATALWLLISGILLLLATYRRHDPA
jgi:hypothetical protein